MLGLPPFLRRIKLNLILFILKLVIYHKLISQRLPNSNTHGPRITKDDMQCLMTKVKEKNAKVTNF